MFRAPIYERDWRPSCIVRRSSSSSVVSGARTAIRVTTAVSSLLKLRLLVDEILTNSEDHYSTQTKSLNRTLFPKFGWRSGLLRTWLSTPVVQLPFTFLSPRGLGPRTPTTNSDLESTMAVRTPNTDLGH